MQLALISDIHSNLPALEAVLAAIDAEGVDEIWCLGDVVGYGADPDECTRVTADRCSICLVGNHDLAVLGEIDISTFSPAAEAAVEWTRDNCEKATLDVLRKLEPTHDAGQLGLYHASPRDPIWEYVLSVDAAADCLAMQKQRLSFIGHSHVALHFSAPEDSNATGSGIDQTKGAPAAAGARLELAEDRWLINPGSVGQPRDGDPRAAWLTLDTEALTAEFHRTEYDIDRAAEAIVAAGLPEHLGGRLYVGQ
jgi:diadenosine tetraphosphatase ApaH/serine/threonine PP2A family protein phosphatase